MFSRTMKGLAAPLFFLAMTASASAQLPPPGTSSDANAQPGSSAPAFGNPSPPAAGAPATESPAPPAAVPDSGPRQGISAIPGLGQFLGPNGIALPGGAGFIRPGPDQIGVEIMTPDGPLQFTVPRRRGRQARQVEEPVPGSDSEAPAFGGAPAAQGAPSSRDGSGSIPLQPVDPDRSRSGGLDTLVPPAPAAARSGVTGASTAAAARELAIGERVFRSRNYPSVIRGVNRAIGRHGPDRGLLQLRSLTYFAMGNFPDAYRDSVVVLADNNVWDWAKLRSMYQSADEYTTQFRALEQQATANTDAPELRFLLGYHYMMMGHRDAARRQFEAVVTLDPSNETARRLVRPELGAPGNDRPPLPAMPADPLSAGTPHGSQGAAAAGPRLVTIPSRSAAPRTPQSPVGVPAANTPPANMPPANTQQPSSPAVNAPPANGPVPVDLGAPGSLGAATKNGG